MVVYDEDKRKESNMKVAVTIGSDQAGDSAFVVWKGFEASIKKAAEYGYDGVELALRSSDASIVHDLKHWISESGIEVSCVTTGRMYAEDHLYFTNIDSDIRRMAIINYQKMIDIAAEFCGFINIGRVRGGINEGQTREEAENLFLDAFHQICGYAEKRGVHILIEPVNRYEINYINNLDQGADFLNCAGWDNGGLHADVFHMNIEDDRIGDSLIRNRKWLKYVHIADSNRFAPGMGHLDFDEIFGALKAVAYDGWISMEILPGEDADRAAKNAIQYVLPWINTNNT